MLFFSTLLLACQSNGISFLGQAEPRGDASVFVEACEKQHATAVAFKAATKAATCADAWSVLSAVTEIRMNQVGLSDLSPLSGLVNLEKLAAYGNGIFRFVPFV